MSNPEKVKFVENKAWFLLLRDWDSGFTSQGWGLGLRVARDLGECRDVEDSERMKGFSGYKTSICRLGISSSYHRTP